MTRRSLIAAAATMPVATAAPPADACDTHTHVFPDPARFPFSPTRSYTPPEANAAQLLAFHRGLGVNRVVIVTPSVYGTDNSATLHGLAAIGSRARGVAVIAADTTPAELERLHSAGVRGVRINLGASLDVELARARFREMQRHLQFLPWHIQLFCPLIVLAELASLIRDASCPVVLDHVGAAHPEAGPAQAGFSTMLELLQEGKLYVKVTHRFLTPNPEAAYRLLPPMLQANPQRILWGTDWPHPGPPAASIRSLTPFAQVEDRSLFDSFRRRLGSFEALILAANPARLYFL